MAKAYLSTNLNEKQNISCRNQQNTKITKKNFKAMRFCFDPLKESFKINLIVTLEAL
jgi:hypothetical protein